MTANGGFLDLNGNNPAISSLSGAGGTITNSSNTQSTLTLNQTTPTTFSGSLQDGAGGLNLTMNGSGTLTLTGVNTYSEATTINAGVLKGGRGRCLLAPFQCRGHGRHARCQQLAAVDLLALRGAAGAVNLTVGNLLTTNTNDAFGGTLNLSGATAAGAELISYGSYSGSQFTTVDINGNVLPGSYLVYTANAVDLPGSPSSGTAAWASGAGNWSVGPWSPNTAPTKAGNTAILNNSSSALVSVVIDVPVSVGTLVLGNADFSTSSGFSISATGANALTMDNSGSTSHMIVQGGTHVISAPITLAGNLSVAPTATSTLTLSGDIGESVTGSALSLDDAGTLILSGSNGYTGGTFVNAGTLVVENPTALPNGSSLTVGAGAASLFGSPAGGSIVLGGAEVVVAGGGNSAAAPSAVPEPGTLALLLAGLASAALYRRLGRRSKAKA